MRGVHVDPYSYKQFLFDSYKIEYWWFRKIFLNILGVVIMKYL